MGRVGVDVREHKKRYKVEKMDILVHGRVILSVVLTRHQHPILFIIQSFKILIYFIRFGEILPRLSLHVITSKQILLWVKTGTVHVNTLRRCCEWCP